MPVDPVPVPVDPVPVPVDPVPVKPVPQQGQLGNTGITYTLSTYIQDIVKYHVNWGPQDVQDLQGLSVQMVIPACLAFDNILLSRQKGYYMMLYLIDFKVYKRSLLEQLQLISAFGYMVRGCDVMWGVMRSDGSGVEQIFPPTNVSQFYTCVRTPCIID